MGRASAGGFDNARDSTLGSSQPRITRIQPDEHEQMAPYAPNFARENYGSLVEHGSPNQRQLQNNAMQLDGEEDQQLDDAGNPLEGMTMNSIRNEYESMFIHQANMRLHDLLVRKRELGRTIAERGMPAGAEVLLPDFDGWELAVSDMRLERNGGKDTGVRLVIRYAHL